MKKYLPSITELLVYFSVLTAFIPFIPFWTMAESSASFFDRATSLPFYIKNAAGADAAAFFILFVHPTIFFATYILGVIVSIYFKHCLRTYLLGSAILQAANCLSAGFLMHDIPMTVLLVLVTASMTVQAGAA